MDYIDSKTIHLTIAGFASAISNASSVSRRFHSLGNTDLSFLFRIYFELFFLSFLEEGAGCGSLCSYRSFQSVFVTSISVFITEFSNSYEFNADYASDETIGLAHWIDSADKTKNRSVRFFRACVRVNSRLCLLREFV